LFLIRVRLFITAIFIFFSVRWASRESYWW